MAYRPESPNLSSLKQSQAFTGYRPQSPDLSSLGTQPNQFDLPQSHHPTGGFGNQYGAQILPKPATSSYQFLPQQPYQQQAGSRMKNEELGFLPDAIKQDPSMQPKPEYVDPTLGVVLKTSFPVARIKRIMQADEDIGKVAQVTPHVVSRALELFMIKLITASSEQARGTGGANAKGPKRVLVQHMKKAIQADDKFDFLAEIVSKIPDAPVKAKKDVGSDSEDAKPRKKAKKRKDDD